MLTMDSTVHDILQNPVGKDIADLLCRQLGKNPAMLQNPLIARRKLSTLQPFIEKKAPHVLEDILRVLNQHPERPTHSTSEITHTWWKEAVVYQIYPRSFQDSNGDGIGDLAGIRKRIPYLKELGVDVVWLSPIYDSPNDDMGYDIRNYRKIMKEFGNMTSFNALLNELHKNDMKLMMDLVVNHTSDEHEWYQRALKDPQSPERDYYIWAKGKAENTPPNNWTSFFSGSAWNYDDASDEWALHLFSKKQMDLNWDNPAMRAEIYDMINWWLDKGVDGFRMDVISYISKDGLEDGNSLFGQLFGFYGVEHYFYGPRLHEYLQEMRQKSFGNYDVFTVGETPGIGMEMCNLLTAEERGELDLVFNFDQLDTPGHSRQEPYEYDLRYLKQYFMQWQLGYGNNCWPSLFFENHDNLRMPNKVDPSLSQREHISKLLAVMQFTLRGTPFLFQGQEIGMTNNQFTSIDDLRDVESINLYHELLKELSPQQALAKVAASSRDNSRTPMQWDSSANGGFSDVTPWLAVNSNYKHINVEDQMQDPESIWSFYRDIISLRHQHQALVYGKFHPVFTRDKNTFCYFRIYKGEKFYIEMNLTNVEQQRPGPLTGAHHFALGNYGNTRDVLRPYEANVFRC